MSKGINNAFITERRSNERLQCDYKAIVRGSSKNAEKFEEIAEVQNLCTSGAYLLMNRKVELGQKLSIKIAFPTGFLDYGSSRLAITGASVVRTENYSEGVLGIAIKFQNSRFL